MTTINIIFTAFTVCALAGLIAYRIGLSTGARAQRLKNQTLRNAQAKLIQSANSSIESLTARMAALLTRQTETAERATQCEARANALATKQESHQAQLEAIMQDADDRVATYARRANPFNHEDRITLQAAANQLDVAANTYSGLQADDRVATYARRANPFNHEDRITLQAAANQLDVAANTYSGLQAGDQVRFARQMQQRLLNLAERLDVALKAMDQQAMQQSEQTEQKAVA